MEVERSITSLDVIDVLAKLFAVRGRPRHIRSDNGPEFIVDRIRAYLGKAQVGTLSIERGAPWETGYAESFHGRVRDELLNVDGFLDLTDAKAHGARCSNEWNHLRPQSSLVYQDLAAFAAGLNRGCAGATPLRLVPLTSASCPRHSKEHQPALTATGTSIGGGSAGIIASMEQKDAILPSALPAGLEHLLVRAEPIVRRTIRLILPSDYEYLLPFDDVVQDTMLELVLRLPHFSYRSEPEFAAWVRKVSTHQALTSLQTVRRLKRTPVRRADVDPQRLTHDVRRPVRTMSSVVCSNEALALMMYAIGQLKTTHRVVLQDVVLEGGSRKDVADRLGKTPAAISMIATRAVNALRNRMNARFKP